jgi:hypothetical protein
MSGAYVGCGARMERWVSLLSGKCICLGICQQRMRAFQMHNVELRDKASWPVTLSVATPLCPYCIAQLCSLEARPVHLSSLEARLGCGVCQVTADQKRFTAKPHHKSTKRRLGCRVCLALPRQIVGDPSPKVNFP